MKCGPGDNNKASGGGTVQLIWVGTEMVAWAMLQACTMRRREEMTAMTTTSGVGDE